MRIYPSYKGGTNSFTLGLLDGFARVGTEHEFKIFVTPWNREMFEKYERVPNFELVEIDESERRWLRRLHRFLPLALKNRLPVKAPNRVLNSRVADLLAREADVMYVPYVPPPRLFPFPDVPTRAAPSPLRRRGVPSPLRRRPRPRDRRCRPSRA